MATPGRWPTREAFARAVEVIEELRSADAIRVLVGPAPVASLFSNGSRAVRFELRPDAEEADSAVEARGFNRVTFERVARDVAEILSALAQDLPEERVSLGRRVLGEQGTQEPSEDVRWKLKYASEHFEIEELRERFWVKATSKHPLQQGFSWGINLRGDDAVRPAPTARPVPYAVLSLRTGPSAPGTRASVTYNQVHMTVDREDVIALRDELDRLLSHLDRFLAKE
jgi:hypothetical protein